LHSKVDFVIEFVGLQFKDVEICISLFAALGVFGFELGGETAGAVLAGASSLFGGLWLTFGGCRSYLALSQR
jgi:hypothetical protein